MARTLKAATADDVRAVDAAIHHLTRARDLLKGAGSDKALQRVRAALTSAGGAARHVRRRCSEPVRALMPFTVLLLVPDYVANAFGQDTYMARVTSADAVGALTKARVECMSARGDIDAPEDLFCIAVIAGEHIDIQPQD